MLLKSRISLVSSLARELARLLGRWFACSCGFDCSCDELFRWIVRGFARGFDDGFTRRGLACDSLVWWLIHSIVELIMVLIQPDQCMLRVVLRFMKSMQHGMRRLRVAVACTFALVVTR